MDQLLITHATCYMSEKGINYPRGLAFVFFPYLCSFRWMKSKIITERETFCGMQFSIFRYLLPRFLLYLIIFVAYAWRYGKVTTKEFSAITLFSYIEKHALSVLFYACCFVYDYIRWRHIEFFLYNDWSGIYNGEQAERMWMLLFFCIQIIFCWVSNINSLLSHVYYF